MFIACFGRVRVDGTPPDDNTHSIPPTYKQTRKGAVVKRICCFTATAARATTMSLPQPAKERNPGAWYAEERERLCVRVFDNERKINRKRRGEKS